MSLKLVSSSDDRALALRDHLLPLVRERGTLEVQRGIVRLTTLKMVDWTFNHWTPFNELAAGEASSPGYRHALERQHTMTDLPYGRRMEARGEGAPRAVGGRWRFYGTPLRPWPLGK